MSVPGVRVTLAALALLGAVGCSPVDDRAAYYEQPKQLVVTKNRTNYVAYVDARSGEMSLEERHRLAASLAPLGPLNSLSVLIREDGSPARAQRLAQTLTASGFARERITIVPGGTVFTDLPGAPPVSPDPRMHAVALAIDHFTSSVPGCPDWQRPNLNDGSFAYSSNFGCANLMNFNQMIVNPGDVVRGVPSGYADGGRSADAVEAYRDGTVKLPPPADQPFTVRPGQ